MDLEFTLNGYICPSGDQDWFKVPIGDIGTYTIDLTSLPADYDLKFYDPWLNLLASSTNGGTNAEQIVYSDFSAGGYYYIQVYGYGDAFHEADSYRLSASWEDACNLTLSVTPTGTQTLDWGGQPQWTFHVTDQTGAAVPGAYIGFEDPICLQSRNEGPTNASGDYTYSSCAIPNGTPDGTDYRFDFTATKTGCTNSSVVTRHVVLTSSWALYIPYMTEKEGRIQSIVSIPRPGPLRPFFETAEQSAQSYLSEVAAAYDDGDVSPPDLEAIARLALAERTTHRALIDAGQISLYGARALRVFGMSVILKRFTDWLAPKVANVPVVGDLLHRISNDLEQATYKLMITFRQAMQRPPQMTLPEWDLYNQILNDALSQTNEQIGETTADALDRHDLDYDLFDDDLPPVIVPCWELVFFCPRLVPFRPK
jgi:hypothetical protein